MAGSRKGMLWHDLVSPAFQTGTRFDVDVDHESLQWIWEATNGKIARWVLALEEFPGMTIHYKRGVEQIIPDALSRVPIDKSKKIYEKDDSVLRLGVVNSFVSEQREVNKLSTGPLDAVGTKIVLALLENIGEGKCAKVVANLDSAIPENLIRVFLTRGVELVERKLPIRGPARKMDNIDWIIAQTESDNELKKWIPRLLQMNKPGYILVSTDDPDLPYFLNYMRRFNTTQINLKGMNCPESGMTQNLVWIGWSMGTSDPVSTRKDQKRGAGSFRAVLMLDAILFPKEAKTATVNNVVITDLKTRNLRIDEVELSEGPELEIWRQAQKKNEKWGPIIAYLEDPEKFASDNPSTKEQMRLKARYHKLENGLLYVKKGLKSNTEKALLLVPAEFRQKLISRAHDHLWAGHVGLKRVYLRLKTQYWWPGLYKDARQYTQRCRSCAQAKMTGNSKAGMHGTRSIWEPWIEISIDIFSGLPRTPDGYKYILTVADTFSRWVEFLPLKTETAEEIATLLVHEIFCRYGVPRRILSDRGAQFTSALLHQLYKLLDIKRGLTAAESPQTNSPAERPHRMLVEALRIYARKNHANWKNSLPYLSFAIRTAVTVAHGYSPYQVMFARNARMPTDLLTIKPAKLLSRVKDIEPHIRDMVLKLSNIYTDVHAAQDKKQDERMQQAMKSKQVFKEYKIGEAVLLKRPRHGKSSKGIYKKLLFPGQDGWLIVKKLGEFKYELRHELTGKTTTALVKDLKLDLATKYEMGLRERAYKKLEEQTKLEKAAEGNDEKDHKHANGGNDMQWDIDNLGQDSARSNRRTHVDRKVSEEVAEKLDSIFPRTVVEKTSSLQDGKMESATVYDANDPFSKIFQVEDVVIFSDVDGMKTWRIGKIVEMHTNQLFVQYYGNNGYIRKKRHYITWKLAWFDERDGKATHAAKQVDPAHEPWTTTIETSEVLIRLNQYKGQNAIRLKKVEVDQLDRLRKER
jgi:transposase InsO family protein